MSDTQYPLTNKLEHVADLRHAIASFLAWAKEQKGLTLCEPYKPQYSWFTPIHASNEQLLMEYFGINLAALDRERRQMIGEHMRAE